MAKNGKPNIQATWMASVGAKVGHRHRRRTDTLDTEDMSYKKKKKKKKRCTGRWYRDANVRNERRHVRTLCVAIYAVLCRNNIVVYRAITQLRAIRLSATVIAFVSNVAPIAVLGRRFIAGVINISSHMFNSNIANRCSFLIACGCSRLQLLLYFPIRFRFVNRINKTWTNTPRARAEERTWNCTETSSASIAHGHGFKIAS